MSENTLNQALRRIGYTNEEMTAHGFSAVASTLLNESGRWHPAAIEKSLAHHDPDRVRSAYKRATFWVEREIGSAECRERVCQDVLISVVDVRLKKNI